MDKPKPGKIELSKLLDDEAALLACFGDSQAVSEIWVRMIPLVQSVTAIFAARYPWIDQDDLTQSVLVEFPKIIRRYKPDKGKGIRKYLYYSFYRATQDTLRKEDPLGIQIPQKKQYPEWTHLSGLEDATLIECITADGYARLDRGEIASTNG